MVRPHLEFAITSWCPYLKKDINMIEKIQRKATKLVPNLKHLNYWIRLPKFGLTDLTTGRLRGDLVQLFKLNNKIGLVEFKKGLIFGQSGQVYDLRRHSKTLRREQIKNCSSHFHFFTNRVVNIWNQLPEGIVSAKTLNIFKSKLDDWLVKKETTAKAQ